VSKTLNISHFDDGINLNAIKDIYFGDSSKPNNLRGLCQGHVPYRVKGGKTPDMSGP
jgi:hypothetical protein